MGKQNKAMFWKVFRYKVYHALSSTEGNFEPFPGKGFILASLVNQDLSCTVLLPGCLADGSVPRPGTMICGDVIVETNRESSTTISPEGLRDSILWFSWGPQTACLAPHLPCPAVPLSMLTHQTTQHSPGLRGFYSSYILMHHCCPKASIRLAITSKSIPIEFLSFMFGAAIH